MDINNQTVLITGVSVSFGYRDPDTNQYLKLDVHANNIEKAKEQFVNLTGNKITKYKIEKIDNDTLRQADFAEKAKLLKEFNKKETKTIELAQWTVHYTGHKNFMAKDKKGAIKLAKRYLEKYLPEENLTVITAKKEY